MSLFPDADGRWADAVLSDDGRYRYRLTRVWDESLPPMLWVMLNPSKADAMRDDHTVRRCRFYAHREACGSIEVINLFAYRATKPNELLHCQVPEGPDNHIHVRRALQDCSRRGGVLVYGWGAWKWKERRGRFEMARYMTEQLAIANGLTAQCLGLTLDGHPRHPSRLADVTPLRPYRTEPA